MSPSEPSGRPGTPASGALPPRPLRSPGTPPAVLWHQAEEEHPGDPDAIRARYLDLMREHGHIVKRQPGQSLNLPCGWPHRPEPSDVHPPVSEGGETP